MLGTPLLSHLINQPSWAARTGLRGLHFQYIYILSHHYSHISWPSFKPVSPQRRQRQWQLSINITWFCSVPASSPSALVWVFAYVCWLIVASPFQGTWKCNFSLMLNADQIQIGIFDYDYEIKDNMTTYSSYFRGSFFSLWRYSRILSAAGEAFLLLLLFCLEINVQNIVTPVIQFIFGILVSTD